MKGYKKYYTQKIVWYLITLIFAVALNFVLPRLMPGDPVSAIAGQAAEGMTDAQAIKKVYDEYIEKFGVNQPIPVQFAKWLKGAVHGDFGVSFSQYPRTVADIIKSSVGMDTGAAASGDFAGLAAWQCVRSSGCLHKGCF